MKRKITFLLALLIIANFLCMNVSYAADVTNFSADRLTDIPFEEMKTVEATKEKVVACILTNFYIASPEMTKSIFTNIGNNTCTIGYMPVKDMRAIFVYISTHDMFYYLYYLERDKICQYTTEVNKRGIDTLKDVNQIGQHFVDTDFVEDYKIMNIGNIMYNLLDMIAESRMGEDL